MTREKLNKILAAHKLWLDDKDGGIRANLIGADLSRANLNGADLMSSINFLEAHAQRYVTDVTHWMPLPELPEGGVDKC